jgi:hypothetical protein
MIITLILIVLLYRLAIWYFDITPEKAHAYGCKHGAQIRALLDLRSY